MPLARKKNKETILNLRTTPEQKALIQRAAMIRGVSAASFILENSLKAAREEISEVEMIQLARQDARLFLATLDSARPNAALIGAFQKYDSFVKK